MAEEENKTQKRQIAVKAKISELVDGKYVKEEGWQPNYIITNTNKNISRVNLIGVVVSEPSAEMNDQNLIIDDGSGKIAIRSFDEKVLLNVFNIGDIVLLIGRPREYNEEKYIVPEIIKKIKNEKWVEVRKKELEKINILEKNRVIAVVQNPTLVKEEVVEDEKIEIIENETIYEKIINKIREMDIGEGVNVESLIDVLKDNNSEKIINNLIEQGEVFEIKPGMLKLLE